MIRYATTPYAKCDFSDVNARIYFYKELVNCANPVESIARLRKIADHELQVRNLSFRDRRVL